MAFSLCRQFQCYPIDLFPKWLIVRDRGGVSSSAVGLRSFSFAFDSPSLCR
jgi:hypothetical protein